MPNETIKSIYNTCPCCGQEVEVVGSKDGTQHYVRPKGMPTKEQWKLAKEWLEFMRDHLDEKEFKEFLASLGE